MRGNHQNRLAHPNCLAHRLKPGRTGIGPAAGHLFQELMVINKIKTERIVNLHHLSGLPIVPKEPQLHFRMLTMPLQHILRKPLVQHIAMHIVPLRNLHIHHLTPQKRRHDRYPVSVISIHLPERKSETFHSSGTSKLREKVKRPASRIFLIRHPEITMAEKILVPDTDDRNVNPAEHIGQSGHQFIEIHDSISTAGTYRITYQAYGRNILVQTDGIHGNSLQHARTPV